MVGAEHLFGFAPPPCNVADGDGVIMNRDEETIRVTVRDRATEDALWGSSGPWSPSLREIEISAFCQVLDCGQRRGEIRGLNQHEDGVWFNTNVWTNPCGHLDRYPEVLAEAATRRAAA